MEERIEKENPDKIILLGDLYYHGPRNPLTQEYNPMEVSKILNNLKEKILCVRGNCDAQVDEMISDFVFQDNIFMDISGKKFMFTHGHKYNENNIPENVDIIVYGHFHTGFIKKNKDKICVNSGSISLPKNNTPNSYLVIDEESIILKDIDGKIIDSIKYL
jgi:hypothetical protein